MGGAKGKRDGAEVIGDGRNSQGENIRRGGPVVKLGKISTRLFTEMGAVNSGRTGEGGERGHDILYSLYGARTTRYAR